MDKTKKYSHAGMGGTFDRLHKGHEALIESALAHSQKVSIGLTIDDFSTNKKLHQIINSYDNRFDQLTKYLSSLDQMDRVNITPLSDVYGPTISDSTIDCLVVTDQTYKGAEEINRKRREVGLVDLPIIKAELIKDKNNQYLSSTRIRQGAINRSGDIYEYLLADKIFLTNDQKLSLKDPQGDLLSNPEEIGEYIADSPTTYVSLVGDITLAHFLRSGLKFDLGLYDGKTQRLPNDEVESLTTDILKDSITNPSGAIFPHIIKAYDSVAGKQGQIIKVTGEEDLLAVALVLLQPLDSLVIYGQPNEGLVVIKVTEEKKEQMKSLLSLNK